MTSIVWTHEAAYRYPQNSHGLAPISLRVEPGERLLITGPSGCGKSTLARCLTGLIPHLYRDYLRTGDAREMKRVLYHNAVDVLSLVTLAARLCRTFANPWAEAEDERYERLSGAEFYGLGRWYAAEGRLAEAEQAYRAALRPFDKAQGRPFDRARDRPFDRAQGRLRLGQGSGQGWKRSAVNTVCSRSRSADGLAFLTGPGRSTLPRQPSAKGPVTTNLLNGYWRACTPPGGRGRRCSWLGY